MKRKFGHGQSIVEVLVVVGIVVLLVTGLIVATTSTVRLGQQSKARSQAVALAREAIEFVRELRNISWQNISSNGTYCLSETKVLSVLSGECPMDIQNQYSRMVTFTVTGETSDVEVTVSWWESSVKQSVKLETVFTDWKTI